MNIACFSFTHRGASLGRTLEGFIKESHQYSITHFANSSIEGGIKGLLKDVWHEYDGIIFICATGIALRYINPYIDDKAVDPAVVVIDDMGKFAISLLSGHLGGANRVTNLVAGIIGAIPVITTASDNRGIEALDLFAKNNGYCVEDKKSITKIMAMMVNGERLGFYTEDKKPICYKNLKTLESLEDIPSSLQGLLLVTSKMIKPGIPHAILRPKNINIGIGCRKGTESKRIILAIEDALKRTNLSPKSIKALGTVEIKKDEAGIIEASGHFNCPLKIFTIDEIRRVQDRFSKSQFVMDTIGVYSVAQPVAYLLGGQLLTERMKYKGITISISKEV